MVKKKTDRGGDNGINTFLFSRSNPVIDGRLCPWNRAVCDFALVCQAESRLPNVFSNRYGFSRQMFRSDARPHLR